MAPSRKTQLKAKTIALEEDVVLLVIEDDNADPHAKTAVMTRMDEEYQRLMDEASGG